jgi:hypothetical protein
MSCVNEIRKKTQVVRHSIVNRMPVMRASFSSRQANTRLGDFTEGGELYNADEQVQQAGPVHAPHPHDVLFGHVFAVDYHAGNVLF